MATNREKKIRGLVKSLNTKLKKKKQHGRVDLGSDIGYVEVERISTGILGLDIALNGGVVRGGAVQFWGRFSCGKTTAALKLCRHAQEEEHAAIVWAAAEAFDKDWARKLGLMIPFSPEELELLREEEGEEAMQAQIEEQEDWPIFVLLQHAHGDALLELFYQSVKSGLFDLGVVDSLGAIKRYREVEEKSLEDEFRGGQGALFSHLQGKLQSAFNTRYDPETLEILEDNTKDEFLTNRTAVVCINQARENMGYSPNGITTYKYTGGEAIKHLWRASVQFKKGERYSEARPNKKKFVYGSEMKIHCDKNKVGPPFREAEWDFYFEDHGDFYAGDVDRAKEVWAWAEYCGLYERAGAYYTIGDVRIKGKDAAFEYVRDNQDVLDELYYQCIERMFV